MHTYMYTYVYACVCVCARALIEIFVQVQLQYELNNFTKMIRFHYVVIRVDGDITCNLLTNNYNLSYSAKYVRKLVTLRY